MVIAKFWERSA